MNAKNTLDSLIGKTRVHFYKPFQVAEILRQHRLGRLPDLSSLETYRNKSKQWRDEISVELVGRKCTSSQKFQDDLFNDHAIPPATLVQLAEINDAGGGTVEAYIYKQFQKKYNSLNQIRNLLAQATPDTFRLNKFIESFTCEPGLKRSIDKVYEIVVYALFSCLVRELKITVRVSVENKDVEIIQDFEPFLNKVAGINSDCTEISFPANVYRVGVTNAADRGLDMWCNFGPAVQVKHITLDSEAVSDIIDTVSSDKIVIVCEKTHVPMVQLLLDQLGDYSNRIQGIITFSELGEWYDQCLSPNYVDSLGKIIIKELHTEFTLEFPSSNENLERFLKSRSYDKISMDGLWAT